MADGHRRPATDVCEIESTIGDNGVEVVVRGELDIETSPGFDACLREHISAGRRTIAVDLRGVSFIDSTGIGVIVRAYKAIGDSGRISLDNVPDRIARTFRLVGLDAFIEMTELTGG